MEPVLYLRVAKSIIGLFGMIGNTLVCLVIHHNHEMHTFTNALIFNQAVIDFLSCVFIFLHSNIPDSGPPSSGIAGHLFCQLWDTPIVLFALLVASTFSLVVITLERYVAIIFPFHYMTLFTRTKTVVLICCIWIFAFIFKLLDMRRYDMLDNKCTAREIKWQKGFSVSQKSVWYSITVLMAQSNSAINFVVYGFKYKKFRKGLWKLFGCSTPIEPNY
ncbi:alpha-1A adrenergic receptor-like [Amphiura filiformis]|uniref:alpha-1A adrenergic receptor-like n=1 Tax=Amphiura filiformis TaxID=82378 RepID=UPI003B20C56B